MFKNQIASNIWSERSPIFKEISIDSHNPCPSLRSTITSLLHHRVSEDFYVYENSLTRFNPSVGYVISNLLYDASYAWLTIKEINVDDDEFDRFCEEVTTWIKDRGYTSFQEVKKVRTFFKKTMNVICLIDPVNKHSIVLYNGHMSIECYHYLQVAIPVYVPWFFEGDHAITEVEQRLLLSLRERTSDKYIEVLAELAKLHDIENKIFDISLKNFEQSWANSQIASVKAALENIDARVKQLMDDISDKLTARRNTEVKYLGLKQMLLNTGEKLLEYFKANKNVKLKRIDEDSLTFICFGYLEVFDKEILQEFLDNKSSIIYEYAGRVCPDKEKVAEALKRVFIDDEYKLRICAEYRVDIGRLCVSGSSEMDVPVELKTYMPNPHINRYSCLGDYSRMMSEALASNDIIMAIELCGMSAKSLNFSDAYVMEEWFKNYLRGDKYKSFEDKNGELHTLKDIIGGNKDE